MFVYSRSPIGKHISTSHRYKPSTLKDGRTLAVETIDGVNNVLWEYTPTGKLSYWNVQISHGTGTSSFGEDTTTVQPITTLLKRDEIDINQDGTEPEQEFTAVESKGSVLNRDASGKFYANNLSIRSPAGTQISTSHAEGWRTLAAETINGVNNSPVGVHR